MGRDTVVKPPRRPRRGRRALKFALLAFLLLSAAALSMLAGAYVSVARTLPSLELADRIPSPETTKIYDSSPEPVLLAELRGLDGRQALAGDQIPQIARDAIVAAEDPRFYERKGMDFFAILRAAWANARHREVTAGGTAITQQLIKNAFVSQEQQAYDGASEPAVAYALETRWTKEKILNEYLNYVYFGSGAYGIQAAAHSYFGVDASALTLGQAALLAGLPASPSAYSPRRDQAAALTRRDLVLNKMYQQRYITSEQLLQALEEPLRLADAASGEEQQQSGWVDLIREQLIAHYGSSTVMNGGLRVIASLELPVQLAADKAVADALGQPGDGSGATSPSAALVCVDVRTGSLAAMVSAGPMAAGNADLALRTRMPAGAAFRPFALTAALQQGISPEATYESGPAELILPTGAVNIPSTDSGPITLRDAVSRASDAVFARLVMQTGPDPVARVAAELGITSPMSEATPALALAGPAGGVTPLEMAMAYATLASGGDRLSGAVVFDPTKADFPVSIVRVKDAAGGLLEENGDSETRVLDRGLAEIVTSCLAGVLSSDAGRDADISRPAAAETGTTDDGHGSWFVGYTPELVTAVWVGYPAGSTATLTDSALAARIWAAFMKAALAQTPAADFATDDAARWTTVDICSESHLLPTDLCPVLTKGLFPADQVPTNPCNIHVPQAVFMPDVVGLSLARARKVLADAGLKYRVVMDNGSLEPEGTVLKQDEKAGIPVIQGTAVVLHVSAGVAVKLTALAGLTLEEAEARLTALGLVPVVVKEASQAVAAGLVISTDPEPGTILTKGATVRLVVSSGPSAPPSSTTTTVKPATTTT